MFFCCLQLVKVFYNRTYFERAGGVWENMTNYEDYMMVGVVSDGSVMSPAF